MKHRRHRPSAQPHWQRITDRRQNTAVILEPAFGAGCTVYQLRQRTIKLHSK